MTTINYEGVDYNVVYIDPSISSAGDGSTCSSALQTFPTTLTDNTVYLIRRTSEEYNCGVTQTTSNSFTRMMFLGMPKDSSDLFYDLIDEDTKTAWGSDDDSYYANVRMDQSSYSNTMTNCCIYSPSMFRFIAQNCYFFRTSAGGSASSYTNHMFYFNNASACIRFEGCKFGYNQYDFDDADFRNNNTDVMTDTNKYPQRKCCGYVYISSAKNVTINNCSINLLSCEYLTSYPSSDYFYKSRECGFSLYNIYNLVVSNVAMYKLFRSCGTYDSNDYVTQSAGCISNGNYASTDTTYRSVYKNITINYIFKTGTLTSFTMIHDRYAHDIECENIKYNFYNMKDFNMSSISLRSGQSSIWIEDCRDNLKINNIECDGTKNSNVKLSGIPLIAASFNKDTVGTPKSYIKNINVKFVSKDEVPSASFNSTIIYLAGQEQEYNTSGSWSNSYAEYHNRRNAGKAFIFNNVSVHAPHNTGYAFHLVRFAGKTKNIYGRVYLEDACLTCDKIYNHYPTSIGMYVYNNSFLNCKEYQVNQSGYNGQRQLDYSAQQLASVYIGKSNGILFNEDYTSKNYAGSYNTIAICPNYLTDGQFYARNEHTFAKSWNVVRTGSNSAASIKFYNHWVSTNKRLTIGQDPIKGIEIVPTTIGKKMVTAYIAVKNISVPSDVRIISNYCGMEVCVPETKKSVIDNEDYQIYHVYDSNGCWRSDDSTWSNDTDLTTFRIQIPIEVKELSNPLNIKFWFRWYDPQGFLYFDPDIKITDITD